MADLVPEPLAFPRGVRFPRPDEIPAGSPPDALARLMGARITTGYMVARPDGEGFTAFIEANIHADHVWRVVRALAEALLPEVAAPLVGIKDDETVLGPYTDRTAALAVFEPYVDALQHDGFLEFGVMFQYRGRTEEVFVRSVKYLQIWTSQPARACAVLEAHGIPPVPDLQFIDNFPRVSESLVREDGNAGWPDVLERLRAAFGELPAREPPEGVT
jgi:hypothetical protein